MAKATSNRAEKAGNLSQSDFPSMTLSEALRLPRALLENYAGEAAAPHDLAMAIDLSPTGSGCSVRLLAHNNFMPAAFLASYGGRLALEMLTRGILVRGALTVGKLYHHEQMVFGPALIEAYELESQFAQYPRIVVPHKVYGGINISLAVMMGVEWFIEHPPCREDFDGMFHLDLFGPFYLDSRPTALRLKGSASIENLGGVTTRLVRKLCKPKHKDYRISAKYEWLKYYLDDCCSRFGWRASGGPRNEIFHRARRLREGKVDKVSKLTVNDAET